MRRCLCALAYLLPVYALSATSQLPVHGPHKHRLLNVPEYITDTSQRVRVQHLQITSQTALLRKDAQRLTDLHHLHSLCPTHRALGQGHPDTRGAACSPRHAQAHRPHLPHARHPLTPSPEANLAPTHMTRVLETRVTRGQEWTSLSGGYGHSARQASQKVCTGWPTSPHYSSQPLSLGPRDLTNLQTGKGWPMSCWVDPSQFLTSARPQSPLRT